VGQEIIFAVLLLESDKAMKERRKKEGGRGEGGWGGWNER